jgi:hypothetical protein
MAKNVRRAMMPECEIYKIELAEGDMFMIQSIHLFDVLYCFVIICIIWYIDPMFP